MQFTRRTTLVAMSAFAVFSAMPGFGAGGTSASKKLRIGVVGAGWLGGTVGAQWIKAGHEVMFSSRNPEELRPLVESLGPLASAGTPREAAAFGEIILIAVPYDAIPQLGKDLADPWKGKIILDACNPPPSDSNPLSVESVANGVGATSTKYLPGTRLVRAFSAVDASAVESSARRNGQKLAVPIASDDNAALLIAAHLVRDAGCTPVVVGNLAAAVKFQRGGLGFRANTTEPELRRVLGL
jgi:predicted dinucleotide-binding enzyme